MAMLDDVKLALRITTQGFDSELNNTIAAGLADLGIAGVTEDDTDDPLIKRAVITFCKLSFGEPEEYDRLKKSYDEQKSQLRSSTGYTDWGDL